MPRLLKANIMTLRSEQSIEIQTIKQKKALKQPRYTGHATAGDHVMTQQNRLSNALSDVEKDKLQNIA